jgi:hypothetical protein
MLLANSILGCPLANGAGLQGPDTLMQVSGAWRARVPKGTGLAVFFAQAFRVCVGRAEVAEALG